MSFTENATSPDTKLSIASLRISFTGLFNGFNVEIYSPNEIRLLRYMGCFGKNTRSRTRMHMLENENGSTLMRERQFSKRTYWCSKFTPNSHDSDSFFACASDLLNDLEAEDKSNRISKDIIDLVSSDDDSVEEVHSNVNVAEKDIVVVVPDSDSDGEDYFKDLKPKCCVNNTAITEKLVLTLQEAFFLSYALGCLQIQDENNKNLSTVNCWKIFSNCERNFGVKYVVYHHFRSKGYVVKSGIKFGGDYVLYRDGPSVNHADYIVIIKYKDTTTLEKWTELLGHVRVATTVDKEIIVVEVNKKEKELTTITEELKTYRIREINLSRKMPVTN